MRCGKFKSTECAIGRSHDSVMRRARGRPDLQKGLAEIIRVGVTPLLRNRTPVGIRVMGYTRNSNHSERIIQNLWEDISNKRMFVGPNATLSSDVIIATPSTSGDFRFIDDVRFANRSGSSNDYREMQEPQIRDLARRTLMLGKVFLWGDIMGAIRDSASCPRRITHRPDAGVIMCAELRGVDLGMVTGLSPIFFCLSSPFGRVEVLASALWLGMSSVLGALQLYPKRLHG